MKKLYQNYTQRPTLDNLKALEKDADINLVYTDFVVDKIDEQQNTRTRILYNRLNEKTYFHQMKDGQVIQCFEVFPLYWSIAEKCSFYFTPDGQKK